jgi:hypothetical protein
LLAGEELAQVREEAADEGEMNDKAPLEPALAEPLGEVPAAAEPAAAEAAPAEPAAAEPAPAEPVGAEPDQPAAKDKKGQSKDAQMQVAETPPLSPERQSLQAQQAEQAEEIANAEEALAADQEILESLIEDLNSAS